MQFCEVIDKGLPSPSRWVSFILHLSRRPSFVVGLPSPHCQCLATSNLILFLLALSYPKCHINRIINMCLSCATSFTWSSAWYLFLLLFLLVFNYFFLNSIPLYGYTSLFIHSAVEGHLGVSTFWQLCIKALQTFTYWFCVNLLFHFFKVNLSRGGISESKVYNW